MEWKLDERTGTWLCGDPDVGCGVYQSKDGCWEANVAFHTRIYGMQARATKEEAMAEAVKFLNDLKADYGE